MVGRVWPTLRVPGIRSSATSALNFRIAVVGAKEPMPRVSKKFVTKPMSELQRRRVRRGLALRACGAGANGGLPEGPEIDDTDHHEADEEGCLHAAHASRPPAH